MSKNSHSLSKMRPNSLSKHTLDSNKGQSSQVKCLQAQKSISLSTQIDSCLTKEQSKLSAVYRNITILDRLPNSIICNIKYLYLSNNYISDIENIQQFTNLQSLSLSYNQISKLSMLRYLTSLQKLQILALEGNPICKSKMFLVYVVGVTSNTNNFRILDSKTLLTATKNECLKNWNAYQQNMNQLFINYIKLVKLVQVGKRQSINRTIRQAGKRANMKLINNCNQDDWDEENLWKNKQVNQYQKEAYQEKIEKLLQFYLSGVQNQVQDMSARNLVKLEHNFMEDVMKILAHMSQSQSQVCSESSSPQTRTPKIPSSFKPPKTAQVPIQPQKQVNIQQIICSMHKLQQKQKQKIQELSYKIMNKPFHKANIQENDEVQRIEQIILNTYIGYKQEIQYYHWKILEKVFRKFRQYVLKRKNNMLAAVMIQGVIDKYVIENCRVGFVKMKQQGQFKKKQQGCNFLNIFIDKKYTNYISNFMIKIRKIADNFNQNTRISRVKSKENNFCSNHRIQTDENIKNGYNQFIFSVQQDYESIQAAEKINSYLANKENKILLKKCFNEWSQIKSLSKLKLQNWNMKQKLRESEQRQSKLTNKVCLLQKLLSVTEAKLKMNQQIPVQPKQLLEQLQQDCQQLKTKNLMSAHDSSPSPRAIRKNSERKQKENIHQNHCSLLSLPQRKFNSSKKILKICERKQTANHVN